MKQLLEKYLKIYVHESSRFLWIASIFFVIFFVTAVFRNYVDAAFLKRYGPQYIPYMLVINALATFVVFAVAERLGRKFLDHYLLSGFLLIYAASVTVLFFMVRADISIAYPLLYQLLYLLDSVLLVYLWNIAGDLFDARQGKRIFPLITSSQVLGTTIGSFTTKPITVLIGDDPTLLVFGAVCFLTSSVFAEDRYKSGWKSLSKSYCKEDSVQETERSAGTHGQVSHCEVLDHYGYHSEFSASHILLSIQYNSEQHLSFGAGPDIVSEYLPGHDDSHYVHPSILRRETLPVHRTHQCLVSTSFEFFTYFRFIDGVLQRLCRVLRSILGDPNSKSHRGTSQQGALQRHSFRSCTVESYVHSWDGSQGRHALRLRADDPT